jgi:hypothetical protein
MVVIASIQGRGGSWLGVGLDNRELRVAGRELTETFLLLPRNETQVLCAPYKTLDRKLVERFQVSK